MIRARSAIAVIVMILLAVVLQTTLLLRLELVTPDLVLLVSILLALTRVRPEAVLGMAFTAGLVVDLLGGPLLGLRAIVFTIVAFVAVRTRERADIGRPGTGLWAGLLTLLGMMILVLVGTVFGETSFLGEGVIVRILQVTVTNTLLALLIAPAFVRVVDGDRSGFGYA